MTNEVIDIYFSTSTKNQQQKVRLPNWLLVLCEKRHNHIFIIMRDDESLWKRGRGLIKHFLSIQFPLVRANVA